MTIWLQGGLSTLLWIGIGFALMRAPQRRWMKLPGKTKAVLGPVLLLVGAVIMVFGLYGIGTSGGVEGSSLSPTAWAAVTLLGGIFVSCQAVGAAMMFSAADPRQAKRPETSESRDSSETKEP